MTRAHPRWRVRSRPRAAASGYSTSSTGGLWGPARASWLSLFRATRCSRLSAFASTASAMRAWTDFSSASARARTQPCACWTYATIRSSRRGAHSSRRSSAAPAAKRAGASCQTPPRRPRSSSLQPTRSLGPQAQEGPSSWTWPRSRPQGARRLLGTPWTRRGRICPSSEHPRAAQPLGPTRRGQRRWRRRAARRRRWLFSAGRAWR
mmetsp:Transcript_30644/g.97850  ORF Transcript_30644/g.97850 Transcript_30644/m.97850 type:complete len:207 (-) Transcript_30644:327-947(-)